MRAEFAANNLLHFTRRSHEIVSDAAMTDAKNTWSIGLPDLSLAKPVDHPLFSPSQSPGLRDDKTNNITVGIQVAALTPTRRFESRSRRTTINVQ